MGENNKFDVFFERLEKRIDKKNPDNWNYFYINVLGKIIKLCFDSKDKLEKAKSTLKCKIVNFDGEPDSIFWCWDDNVADFIEEKSMDKNRYFKNKNACISFSQNVGIVATNFKTKKSYYITEDKYKQRFTFFPYLLIKMFAQWALTEELFYMHGAAISIDGKGALIVGDGKTGKSTLSVSCMLDDGIDFIADDFLLINKTGNLTAMPLYNSIILNKDTIKALKCDNKVIYEDENGRAILDNSDYKYPEKVNINMIFVSSLTDDDEPKIIKPKTNYQLIRFIVYIENLLGFLEDTDLLKNLISRFFGIPLYELKLCKDIEKNKKMICNFIKEIKSDEDFCTNSNI